MLLQGCQSAGRVPNSTSCTPAHCLEAFSSDSIPQDAYWQFDSLAVLPPSINLEEKGLNGETTRKLYIDAEAEKALIEQLDTISASYQLTNIPVNTDSLKRESLVKFEQSVWADNPSIDAILSDKSQYGNPRLARPAKNGPIVIPTELIDATSDNTCCLLVTRLSGWHHTQGAIHSKVAFTSILGSFMGGVGPSVSFGQAISDMAVIRKEDGEVLWSARLLSNGHISQLRATARDYYLQVYESKIEHQMPTP